MTIPQEPWRDPNTPTEVPEAQGADGNLEEVSSDPVAPDPNAVLLSRIFSGLGFIFFALTTLLGDVYLAPVAAAAKDNDTLALLLLVGLKATPWSFLFYFGLPMLGAPLHKCLSTAIATLPIMVILYAASVAFVGMLY